MRKRRKEPKHVSRRPEDLAFKQQYLVAWQPLMIPATVLPVLIASGLLLIAVGAGVLALQSGLKTFTVDYTYCRSIAQPKFSCYDLVDPTTASDKPCRCLQSFTLPESISDQVNIYYRLHNFMQNHRLYCTSRDDHQLRGHNVKPIIRTAPLDQTQGLYIAPAGLVANSMFNDTIHLLSHGRRVPLTANGISWPSDFNRKFQGGLKEDFKETVKPPSWNHTSWDFPTDGVTGLAQGFKNQDFINWMRIGALPRFRKLYRKVIGGGLPKGTYQLEIEYRYPVSQFDGRKEIVLATTNALGGGNLFLGMCCAIEGTLTLLIGLVLLAVDAFRGRQLGDSRYMVWKV